jgi:hypothetical protein
VEWVILIAVLGLVLVLPVLLYRPPALFVVRISRGAARPVSEKVTAGFLAAVEDVAAQSGVQSGEVCGVQKGRRISLWFSCGLPGDFQQRLRNWWGLSGWTVPAGTSRQPRYG